ncbi:DnaA regulatory inactivator Hda [Xanthomonadaceae bacterium XH05]|nr:DnaA regulatory inactivator Hda [Xanthomonadaceae bacterium XH05]
MNTTPQLPLALRPAPDFRFDTFVGSPETVEALREIAEGSPGFAYLSGPAGSGKTHLALATVQNAAAQGIAVQYVPLERLKGKASEGLVGLERLGLIVLDNLETLLSAREDEIALFDFHNRARASGSAVLYVARETPAALPPGLPDLRSRLGQCTQLILPRVDDVLRHVILQRKAEARGWLLDDAAIGFLLRRVGRDMASMSALLDRLDRASLAEQRRVTVPFIRAFLEQDAAGA